MKKPSVEALRGGIVQIELDRQYGAYAPGYVCQVGRHPENGRKHPPIKLRDGRLCCPHCAARDGLS